MLDWIKNITKEHPAFWKAYLSKFDSDKTKRYVALSTETTGLNSDKDKILSIGAIRVVDNNIIIGDAFELIIEQDRIVTDAEVDNEFLLQTRQFKLSEKEAIENFIDYLGNSILVGHRIQFDIEIINESLEKLSCGRLKNQALDIEVMYKKLHEIGDKNFSLDELRNIHKIEKVDRISTSEDAYTIALLFLKLKSRLGLK